MILFGVIGTMPFKHIIVPLSLSNFVNGIVTSVLTVK